MNKFIPSLIEEGTPIFSFKGKIYVYSTLFQLISENFKKTLQPNKLPVEEKKRLPDLRSTINHGTFDNYNEGLRFIRDTQEEDILSKWSVVECENGKRRCPGNHKPGKL